MTATTKLARDPVLREALMRRVEDAVRMLRRGQVIAIRANDGIFLGLCAEAATGDGLAILGRRSEETAILAMTSNRAAVLRINPTGEDIVCVPVAEHFNSRLIRSLADPTQDMSNPVRGPLIPITDPVPEAIRAGVRLCKLGQLLPMIVAVPTETIPEDVVEVSAEDIATYDEVAAVSLTRISSARVPLAGAENTRVIAFRPMDGGVEHLAIVIGDPPRKEPVLARLHSECFTGDLLGSLKCDCGQQLRGAIEEIGKAGGGVLLYLAQEGRGIGLMNKLRAYRLQDEGFDTIEANERLGFDADERLFLPAVEMLRNLGFTKVRLMTNNPDKVESLTKLGIDVVERVQHQFPSNAHNELYLATKAKRSGHYLETLARKPGSNG